MKIKPRSVRLSEHDGRIVTTMDVRHSYVKDGSREYLIGKYPEGDFAIHQINCGRELGYCGDVITFLMDDGDLVEVKGPVPCDDLFGHAVADRLAKVLNRPEIRVKAFRIQVGFGLADPHVADELVYEDANFVLGDWRRRIRPVWVEMDVRINARVGAMCICQRVFNNENATSPMKSLAEKCVTGGVRLASKLCRK